MYLSDLFYPNQVSIYKNIKGTCIVCSRETEIGHDIDYSTNFTKWNLLQAGNCICPKCYELTRNQDYRRSMWVINREGIKFFKKKDILEHILNPPDPPFAMYLTRTWQKQGFFKLINKVNFSKEHYFTALDMEVIYVDLKKAKVMSSLAKELRKQGLTKKELETGDVYPSRFKEIDLKLIEKLQEYKNQKLWSLIIYAIN